jgi:hypothetical protein
MLNFNNSGGEIYMQKENLKLKVPVLLVLLLIFLFGCSGNTSNSDVDVDLTALNDTLLAAQVDSIMRTPQDYAGQSIRVSGIYGVYDGHHYIEIWDACCCIGWFEFVLSGDYNYPEVSAIIELTGVYESAGQDRYYLAVDEMIIS